MRTSHRRATVAHLLRAATAAARPAVETLEGRQLFSISYLAEPVYTAAGDGTATFAVGDFNGDGRPDVAAGNAGGGDVTILLNNGSGTLTAAGAPLPLGFGPARVLVTDVDADGKADLAAHSGQQVKIFRGNGDGTFAAPTDLDLEAIRFGLAFADLSGDGRPEMIASVSGGTGAAVWQNVGAGAEVKFENKVLYTGPAEAYDPDHIAVADVTGDGNVDLVPVSYGGGGLNVMPNAGDGSFLTGGHTSDEFGASDPVFSTVADLNGDGRADVVSMAVSGGHFVYLQEPGGSFATGQFVAGLAGEGSAVADVNGDGRLDIVSGNKAYGAVTVNHGNGDGTFATDVNAFLSGATVDDTAVADFNGDGKPDVLFADGQHDRVGILFNGVAAGGGGGGGGGGGTATTVDLSAGSVSGLKSTAKAGDKVNAKVRVTNAGDKALNGKVTVEFFASTDGTLDAPDRRLGKLTKTLKLAAGKAASLAVALKMPKLADGAYTVLARLTGGGDSTPDNNVAALASPVTFATPKLDVAAQLTSVAALTGGKTANVGVKLSNAGGVLAKGTARVKLYASTDGTLAGAEELATASPKLNLKPGRSATVRLAAKVPAGLSGQQRFLIAVVTFNKDADAANNTATTATPVPIA